MIVRLNKTTTSAIAGEIDELHVERGEAAQGRVLTLVIITEEAHLEEALATVNAASREHPCRLISIVTDAHDKDCPQTTSGDNESRGTLDAEIRFGSDAGAGEVIVLKPVADLLEHSDALVIPLLVPDAPLVVWWPTNPPRDPSADPIGSMSSSRITDVMNADDSQSALTQILKHPSAKDVDLSWTRTTIWRAMLASMLDQPPHLPIQSVRLSGQDHYLPLELLASWLALKLQVPVQINRSSSAQAITGIFFERSDGTMSIERHKTDQARINQPGQATQTISMPLRTPVDCMSEELGRLYPDEVYHDVITRGWSLVNHNSI